MQNFLLNFSVNKNSSYEKQKQKNSDHITLNTNTPTRMPDKTYGWII